MTTDRTTTSDRSANEPASPAAPRLFDFQVNGFAGIDFQSDNITEQELAFAVGRLRAHQVGGIFLTLITDDEARLAARFARLETFRRANAAINQMIRGYHLEGPWLNPGVGYCGAHRRELMCPPKWSSFQALQKAAGGNIKLVTLAPEWEGSIEFIAALTQERVHVAIGHSDANCGQIDAAIQAGLRFCTHLGNGVPLQLHRHDNVVQRLLARDELYACFIPDGIHLPPFVLRNFVRAKPPDRVLFTTDCISAAGAPPGEYTLGRHLLRVGADGIARDAGPSGGFAGSSLAPDRGVELTAQFLGLSYAEAWDRWSRTAMAAFGVHCES